MRYSNRIYLLFPLLFLIIFLGCQDSIITECDTVLSSNEPLANFSSIQNVVLTPNCALSGCHAGASPTGGLNLESGQAYNNLINNGIITIGDSENSLIIKRLRGVNDLAIMPPDGQINSTYIDSIALWIDNGALNN